MIDFNRTCTAGNRQPLSIEERETAESALLGSILIDPCCLFLLPKLQDSHFRKADNRDVFRAMKKLSGTSMNAVELVECLREEGTFETIGGADRLVEIAHSVPNAAHAQYYFEMVTTGMRR